MTDCWSGVGIYGLQSEIDRFRRMCIEPDPRHGAANDTIKIVFDRVHTVFSDAEQARLEAYRFLAWDFDVREDSLGSYRFMFDTSTRFPEKWFKHVAELFPKLAFHCSCIAEDDEFMGDGWFNPPPGGEDFRQNLKVPKNYWTTGPGYWRTPEAEAQHRAFVEKVAQAAYDVSMEEEDPVPF